LVQNTGTLMNSASHAVQLERSQKGSIFWPRRILGPQPGLKEINLVCWALFVAFLVVPICVVQWIQVKRGEGSITRYQPDFIVFYGFGEIARDYPPTRIYDYALEKQVFTSIAPEQHNGLFYGPSPYPPFVALFFRILAHFSFETAYLLWLAISLVLYLTGIGAAAITVFPGERLKLSLIFCFALAFFPFVFSAWLNGQLSTVAVCAVGLAIYLERRGSPFLSGLALAMMAYKPTLLVFLLPMLLLKKQFKALAGFIAGAATLFVAGTAFGGFGIWPAYVHLLETYGRFTEAGGRSILQLKMYLDFSSISHLMRGGRTPVGLTIMFATAAMVAGTLLYLLWKSRNDGRPAQWLAWAATLTWTLLLNVYVPIYDSVLAIVAVVLTLGALRDLGWRNAEEWITFLAVVIFAASWRTESIANAYGIPLLSITLIILGVAQLVFLYRATQQGSPQIVPSAV
jgi:hypothetical protein